MKIKHKHNTSSRKINTRDKNKTSEGFEVLKGPPKWGVVRDRVDRGTESDTVTGVRWASDGRMVEGLFTLTTLAACSIRAVLISPHISCGHDAVARARKTDRGLFDPEIRPFISMCYI